MVVISQFQVALNLEERRVVAASLYLFLAA